MKKVSVDNFRSDPMFPRIERAVAEQLAKGNVVAPVDVLVSMGLLHSEQLGDWRRGRVTYLERVITSNLPRISRVLRAGPRESDRRLSLARPEKDEHGYGQDNKKALQR